MADTEPRCTKCGCTEAKHRPTYEERGTYPGLPGLVSVVEIPAVAKDCPGFSRAYTWPDCPSGRQPDGTWVVWVSKQLGQAVDVVWDSAKLQGALWIQRSGWGGFYTQLDWHVVVGADLDNFARVVIDWPFKEEKSDG